MKTFLCFAIFAAAIGFGVSKSILVETKDEDNEVSKFYLVETEDHRSARLQGLQEFSNGNDYATDKKSLRRSRSGSRDRPAQNETNKKSSSRSRSESRDSPGLKEGPQGPYKVQLSRDVIFEIHPDEGDEEVATGNGDCADIKINYGKTSLVILKCESDAECWDEKENGKLNLSKTKKSVEEYKKEMTGYLPKYLKFIRNSMHFIIHYWTPKKFGRKTPHVVCKLGEVGFHVERDGENVASAAEQILASK